MADERALRDDWTDLCRFVEKRAAQGNATRMSDLHAELRYLMHDDAAWVLFENARLGPSLAHFGKPPILGKQRRAPTDGETEKATRQRGKRSIRLRRMWRWHLLAGGCEVPYPWSGG